MAYSDMTNPQLHFPAGGPWYREAFRENYLKLYGHRDTAEARRAVAFLAAALRLEPRHRLLDLCCGAGRHLAFLQRHVGQAIGLDLSEVLLRTALARRDDPAEQASPADSGGGGVEESLLVQGDMRRLPFASGVFDRLVNLFTSFGYFDDDADNLTVLREMARVLHRPAGGGEEEGGLLVIDHINRPYLLDHFQPHTERMLPLGEGKTAAGVRVIEERHWDAAAGRVTKQIIAEDGAGGRRQWSERVRVWSHQEWEALLRMAGLLLIARYGDYDGSPLTRAAPRLIMIARHGAAAA